MPTQNPDILSVAEVNRLARITLEKGLPSCWIQGEISNLTRAASGHWYFSIKDATASARCVMFKARNQFVDWSPREGEHVQIRAQGSLYEPRGEFQLLVEAMRKAGQGNLFEAFVRLKEKLLGEGLFAPERKMPIPRFPRCFGVVTSPQGAAVHDVLTTLRRRWPAGRIVVYPCLVQGDNAPARIIHALGQANQRLEADVLLLVRGGGSLEDLWAFNDEGVARAVAASRIPVVSGIGHESDFSIADFVADHRAPTPTGAAEVASPDGPELLLRMRESRGRITRSALLGIGAAWQHHDHLRRRLRHPKDRLQQQQGQLLQMRQRMLTAGPRALTNAATQFSNLRRHLMASKPFAMERVQQLPYLRRDLRQSMSQQLTSHKMRLSSLTAQLELLCPIQVLRRGYSIVRNAQGQLIVSSAQVTPGQQVSVELAQGRFDAEVTGIG